MPSRLNIDLLGTFRLSYGGEPVTSVDTPRMQSLLAYLVLHCEAPQSRQYLSFRFWPDSTEKQARTNLRQLLHHSRNALPDADRFVHADTQALQWNREAPFTLDVAAFERAVDQAEDAEHRDEQVADLEEAVEVYQGDLLPSCYDEWIEPERERLRQRCIAALDQLVQGLEEQRAYQKAIRYARRLLQKDELREATYRCLMRLHALNDDRASALRVYHTCASVLEREFGVAPSPATREIHERLLATRDEVDDAEEQSTFLSAEMPLVGRQQEWDQLRTAWESAIGGVAHFALIGGEAGIGKTRLAEELLMWAGRQGMTTVQTRCYAAEGRLAYAPVTDWLRTEPFRHALSNMDDMWLTEVTRIFPELLVDRPGLARPEPLAERWQRQHFFEALARTVLAVDEPLLLVIDDLQWCDRDTLEWLRYLLRFASESQILLGGTARKEEIAADHPLEALLFDLHRTEQVTEIHLGPLDVEETASLATHVSGDEFEHEVATELYRETEGNPLFVVESVRAQLTESDHSSYQRPSTPLVESSSTSDSGALPPKVQAVIVARLAQLSQRARALVDVAAVVGRAFTVEVLAEAGEAEEEDLVQALDELWQRRIVREQGAEAYDFSHDKLREVAYAEISPARRRLLHRRVAQALETVYTDDLERISGQLAVHYEEAGLPDKAIPYYQQAAEQAQHISANDEAIRLFRRALSLLEDRPDRHERAAQELALQMELGASLVAAHNYAAPEVIEVYSRARALCEQLGKPLRPPVLRALSIASVLQSEHQHAHELGHQLYELAKQEQDPVLLVEAHYVLGVTSFWMGRFGAAREHLAEAVERYDRENHRTHIRLYAQDPGAVCQIRLAQVLWYLGYPEQASHMCRKALALAQELEHPFTLVYTLIFAVRLHLLWRDVSTAQTLVASLRTILAEQGPLMYGQRLATVYEGWLMVERRAMEEGIVRMREGLAAYQEVGARLALPSLWTLLARAYQRKGAVKEGLRVLEKALDMAHRRVEHYFDAELHRLRGEFLLEQGAPLSEAEAALTKAVETARQQKAGSLELRAAMSLGCLWKQHGEGAEAAQTLRAAYEQFSEGFDTPDLKEAHALLGVLSA